MRASLSRDREVAGHRPSSVSLSSHTKVEQGWTARKKTCCRWEVWCNFWCNQRRHCEDSLMEARLSGHASFKDDSTWWRPIGCKCVDTSCTACIEECNDNEYKELGNQLIQIQTHRDNSETHLCDIWEEVDVTRRGGECTPATRKMKIGQNKEIKEEGRVTDA